VNIEQCTIARKVGRFLVARLMSKHDSAHHSYRLQSALSLTAEFSPSRLLTPHVEHVFSRSSLVYYDGLIVNFYGHISALCFSSFTRSMFLVCCKYYLCLSVYRSGE